MPSCEVHDDVGFNRTLTLFPRGNSADEYARRTDRLKHPRQLLTELLHFKLAVSGSATKKHPIRHISLTRLY